MGKNKTFLWILLVIALVAAMAALPILTGHFQDQATLGTPAIGQIQNVELVFEKGLPGMGLLALMYQGEQRTPITELDAGMTRKEALQAALDAMLPYQETGLIDSSLSFEPYLVESTVLSTEAGQACIVWNVIMVARKDDQTKGDVDLILEAATGRVMSMVYSTESLLPKEDREEVLDTFANLFFSQLGIADYSQAAVNDLQDTYIGDDGAVAQRYRFGDAVYGEIVVNLFVHQHGFYITFFGF